MPELPSDVLIERIFDLPSGLEGLVALSLREQFPAIDRLQKDWAAGTNRFDRPGEAVFTARAGTRLVGICGLNRDPYLARSEVGRVRHLYVDPEFRRRGVARGLVTRVIEQARESFERLRLRTLGSDADLFYVALGFRRVASEPEVTHEVELVPNQSTPE
jgi:GNAT superfamily N-acetyltransferase